MNDVMPPDVPAFTLRVPVEGDAADWFTLFDDPEIMRYISAGETRPFDWYVDFVARQQQLARDTGVCLFAVVVPDTNGVPRSEGVQGSEEVQGSLGVQGSEGLHRSEGVQGSEGLHRSEGVQGSEGVHRSEGVKESERVHRSEGARAEQVAGFVGLQPWSRDWGPVGRLEIGWRLGARFHGRGLATAAASAALERGRAAGLPSPIAMIDLRNAPSIGVATKLRMTLAQRFDAPDGAQVGMWVFAHD